ncbi:MAG: YbfB/YjiJ family MFS transporter [Caldimonas sp.]
MPRSRRASPLIAAASLALASAVSLGFGRFAYGLLLPSMRADLVWSYFTAGAMNTVNAAGYLAGALVAPAALRKWTAGQVLAISTAATALMLAAHGLVATDAALYVLRTLVGVVSALSLVSGAVVAARVASHEPPPRSRAVPVGLVLGLYYGGTGLGIVATAAVVPMLMGGDRVHPWQPSWIGIGAVAMVASAVVARVVRDPGDGALASGASQPRHEPLPLRAFLPSLVAYGMFGLGYIGYMTFVVTLLREQQLRPVVIDVFFAMLGFAVVASSWIWARMLQRFRGGESMAVLNGLLAVATVVPVVSTAPMAVFASGLLLGAVFLSLVASTTALVRHNLSPPQWAAGIAAFTVVFAAGQIIGPVLVGLVADRFGGLRPGLAVSALALFLGALAATRQRPLLQKG